MRSTVCKDGGGGELGMCAWGCGWKTNRDGRIVECYGRRVEVRVWMGRRWCCMSVCLLEGGGGKWFNYKPNTISLLLTRDFMVRPMFGRNS